MRYLSEQWIEAADAAVKAAASEAPSQRLVIDQRVEGAADYRITIAGELSSIELVDNNGHTGVDDRVDAVFSQSLATASAVAQGTTDAHQAFLLGHIRFEGDIDVLIAQRDSFTWLETVLAPVLEATTF